MNEKIETLRDYLEQADEEAMGAQEEVNLWFKLIGLQKAHEEMLKADRAMREAVIATTVALVQGLMGR